MLFVVGHKVDETFKLRRPDNKQTAVLLDPAVFDLSLSPTTHKLKTKQNKLSEIFGIRNVDGLPEGDRESVQFPFARPYQKGSIPWNPAQKFLRFGSHRCWVVPVLALVSARLRHWSVQNDAEPL